MEWLFPMGPMQLLFGELDQSVQMPCVTLLQEGIQQHRAEGRRQRKGKRRLHPITPPAFQNLQQRHVRFIDGLEKPALFQKLFMFRMANEGQMRVENEREVTGHEAG